MPPLALITGGCRRLGAAIAARLANTGHDLALHATNDCELDPVLAGAVARSGRRAEVFTGDLLDDATPAALIARVVAAFGRAPDLLVNSASTFAPDTIWTAEAAAMREAYTVNCIAPTLLMRALHTHDDTGKRCAVTILDQRVRHPNLDQFAYTMSKLAMMQAVRLAAQAFAPRLRVNAVAPGLTLPTEDYGAGQLVRLAERMPLARLPAPDDIGDAVLYLAAARSVTGETLFVDGGANLLAFERDFVFLYREG